MNSQSLKLNVGYSSWTKKECEIEFVTLFTLCINQKISDIN